MCQRLRTANEVPLKIAFIVWTTAGRSSYGTGPRSAAPAAGGCRRRSSGSWDRRAWDTRIHGCCERAGESAGSHTARVGTKLVASQDQELKASGRQPRVGRASFRSGEANHILRIVKTPQWDLPANPCRRRTSTPDRVFAAPIDSDALAVWLPPDR